MMNPRRESSRPALRLFAGKIAADSTVRRRLDGGLVALHVLHVELGHFAWLVDSVSALRLQCKAKANA